MNGHKFEYKCAKILRRKGYHHVSVTKKSGDQGVDILAYKHFAKYAIQCKYYSHPVGNKAVQEVYAGGTFYDCDKFIVMTNAVFTRSARSAADKLGVRLWERCSLFKSTGILFEAMRILNLFSLLLGLAFFEHANSIADSLSFPSLFTTSALSTLINFILSDPVRICLVSAGLCGWLGWQRAVFSLFSAVLYFSAGIILKAPLLVHGNFFLSSYFFFLSAAVHLIHVYFLKPKS